MMDVLMQAILFLIFMSFGAIPAIFVRNRFKIIFALIFGILIGYAAIHEYNQGKSLIISLLKYTLLITLAVILYEFTLRRVVKVEDFLKRIEYLEGRLNAVINALKKEGILKKEDEKVWLSKFGENFEFLKKDDFFDYYKVWGSKGSYIVKIDRETGQLAGYEKVTIFKGVLKFVKYGIPALILLFVSVNAFLGYKEGISITFSDIFSKIPGIPYPIQETRNCSVPLTNLLVAISQNKTEINPINESAWEISYENKSFLGIKNNTHICFYEGNVSCGCIDLSTLGGK